MGLLSRHQAALAALAMFVTPAYAEPADPVVVEVGATALRASDVARRLSAVPAFQRRTFGATDAEIRRHFVDAVLVPELLVGEDARQRHLDSVPRVRLRLREALQRALGEALLTDARAAGTPDELVRAYYESHRDDYEKPERIRIARILVADEALARKVLSEAKGSAGLEHWNQLARDQSLDAATKLRGGMLGFVFPDGRTDVPQVAVDPVLYTAASKVKDGELVTEPVKEGTHLAVVWRRGTLPKISRSLDSQRDTIVAILVRERAEQAFAKLREDLRRQGLKEANPALIEALPPDPPDGPAPPRPSASEGTADPVPRQTARGLR
jgi:peptidyl-prolyl cis-trans isomerase C